MARRLQLALAVLAGIAAVGVLAALPELLSRAGTESLSAIELDPPKDRERRGERKGNDKQDAADGQARGPRAPQPPAQSPPPSSAPPAPSNPPPAPDPAPPSDDAAPAPPSPPAPAPIAPAPPAPPSTEDDSDDDDDGESDDDD